MYTIISYSKGSIILKKRNDKEVAVNFRVIAISYHHNKKELIECAQKFIRSMGGEMKSVQFIVLDMNDSESLNSSSR
ncbi:hypothetical protein BU064_08360 [Staphylococcus succinus]|nr:hypothetical protein BU064_08360 [Staphylococcus succinus]